jgi:hypothetical protein
MLTGIGLTASSGTVDAYNEQVGVEILGDLKFGELLVSGHLLQLQE